MVPDLRSAFEGRERELGASLDARAPHVLRQPVALLLAAFGRSADSGILAAYVAVLANLPPWAVTAACGQLARGLVDGVEAGRLPTAAVIYQTAEGIIEPWRKERVRILEVLTAAPPPSGPPVSRETRAEIADRIHREMDAIRAEPDPLAARAKRLAVESRDLLERREEEARVRRYEAANLDPHEHGGLAASPELRRLLARQAKELA